MIKINRVVAALGAIAAFPGIAQAGTSTATSTASFKVVNQCSVTGANINLGTYTTSNTWDDVFAVHGHIRLSDRADVRGTLGLTGINWGSVTCDNATPYTLKVQGRGTEWGFPTVVFTIDGKLMAAWPMIKKIGTNDVADAYWVTPGIGGSGVDGVAGVGSGQSQAIIGHIWFDPGWGEGPDPNKAVGSDKLGVAGVYVADLDYTLNF